MDKGIVLPAKFKVYSFVSAVLAVIVLSICFYLLCLSYQALQPSWIRFPTGILILILGLRNLLGIFWMLYGKELIQFETNALIHTRMLFHLRLKQKTFYFSLIKDCWVNSEIDDGAYLGKSDFMLLTRAVYPVFGNTFGATFSLTGGKIFLDYSGKIYRMGNHLRKEEAEEIAKSVKINLTRDN